MSYSIESRIATAISSKNLIEMIKIKEICDKLHDGEESVSDVVNDVVVKYTIEDLPTDSIYEQLDKTIDSLNTIQTLECDTKAPRTTKYIKSTYFMGSVPKKQYIEDIVDAILMPKYDGVSCGMTFLRGSDNMFSLSLARTRGVTETKTNTTVTSRKYQDITVKAYALTGEIVQALNNEEAQNLQLGNYKLKDVIEIVIRGEIVLKNTSLGAVPASIVAGKLNGGMDVWTNYINNIVIKPFEIVRITSKAQFTITQLEAMEFFNTIGLSCPYELAKRIRPTNKSLNYVQSLFNSSFNDEVIEPIDGVVYCAQSWLYPYDKSDNGKTNYGKYAWKPSNECTTTITSIEETRSKDGYIEFSVIYEPIIMEGKEYSKCKIVPTTINKFIDKFGIGSTVTIILRDNISPYIKECEIPLEGPFTPWHYPNHCTVCNSELTIENKKDSTRIKCNNDRCNATIIKLCADACKQLKIAKCADKTIEAFFKKNNITQYSIFDLLTHRKSPAQLQFRSHIEILTVQEFMKLVFPNIRGPKQFSTLLDNYEVASCQLDKIISHKALVNSIVNDDELPFFSHELARAFAYFMK